ncbi:copper chaperone PCu(A)C [Cellulomonas sp. APG4]|uniref:copper chaperone PCu(A)C n=1 Tax=Cellulomonas sp. APG4 TaxID=1538656 RepID=UPI00137B285C|nr:copper chaperone PCu(A)C [Cellulomonas sp. APG4]NCT90075.1 copper chaperone PCu(A)C [Cellulomonas sp. APG4]
MHARTSLTAVVLATLALAGCTASGAAPDAGTPTPVPAARAVTLEDGWVKATDSGMTGAFGRLANAGDADAAIAHVATPAAGRVELHETVEDDQGQMVMRQKEGGFTVPAGGGLDLEPGGDHLMLMELAGGIAPGDEVTLTITFADDSTLEVTVPAKEFAGADESYAPGHGEDG